MNFLQVALPFLAITWGIGKSAWLITAFTLSSSIAQPLFGMWLDKHPGRWALILGTAWMSVFLGFIGICHYFPIGLLLSAIAGLGTAVFHPGASARVAVMAEKRKSFMQSLFIACGNVGWALAPLLFVPFLQKSGIRATPFICLPGLLASIGVFLATPKEPAPRGTVTAPRGTVTAPRGTVTELVKIMLTVAMRSLCYFGLISFLPLYLSAKGLSGLKGSRLLFLMLFSGALGGVVGGWIADRIGRRKPVLIISLFLSTPLLFLSLHAESWFLWVMLALGGASLLASFSLTVGLAQSELKGQSALASGLTLGFGTGIGGLGVGILGTIVEGLGPGFVVTALVSLPIFAGLTAVFIKER
jgi:FSR family fosmidomycin resistance protein-like MFS transporter